MLKSCPYCGRIHERDYDCGQRPGRIRYNRSKEEMVRYTRSMREKAREIKERQKYLCPICLSHGDLRNRPLEAHHIIKLRLRPDLLLEDGNLIALCEEHHKQADRGEISEDLLRELARKRDGNIPPEVGVPAFL